MEDWNIKLTQLRDEIMGLPLTRNGKRQGITDDLRKAIIALYKVGDLGGEVFCERLGISYSAFNKWKRDFRDIHAPKKEINRFKRIEMISEPESQTLKKSSWTIEGPLGLKITGLNILELASLWRSLC